MATAGSARRVGVGLACYPRGTGLGPFEGATVRVDPQGTVYVLIGVAAQGQGHTTTLAQIAAAELGASLDDVVVLGGDTSLMPYGMGTGGSRVMVNAGPAVARTAAQVRERAAVVAAEIFECAPADVRFEASRAFVAGVPDRTVPLGRLAQAAIRSKTLGASSGEPGLNACTWFYPDTVTWAFGGQACAVEVDGETCRVRPLRHAVLHDPGRAGDRATGADQPHGGAPPATPEPARLAPRATPPRISATASSSDALGRSPSHSVATTMLITGVASRPSEVVTAGRPRPAIAMAQYASAVPGRPA